MGVGIYGYVSGSAREEKEGIISDDIESPRQIELCMPSASTSPGDAGDFSC